MRSSEPMATRLGRVCRALLLAGLGALAGATVAGAQDARGSISGRVTDTSGAVLPGVSVTVVNTETNSALEPGGVDEEVRVAERPVLETGSATMGQVIDSKLISEIPLGGSSNIVSGARATTSSASG